MRVFMAGVTGVMGGGWCPSWWCGGTVTATTQSAAKPPSSTGVPMPP